MTCEHHSLVSFKHQTI